MVRMYGWNLCKKYEEKKFNGDQVMIFNINLNGTYLIYHFVSYVDCPNFRTIYKIVNFLATDVPFRKYTFYTSINIDCDLFLIPNAIFNLPLSNEI